MDLSFNLVASKCEAQLSAYQHCVLKHKDADWQTACKNESNDLTRCADERIPYLPLLKTQCAGQIQSYSGCLASASAEGIPDSAVQERCGASLKDLWQCCERVMASAEAKAPQQQRT